MTMQYRRFGRTEIRMPVFSCGGMRYQHKWQDVPLDEVPPENQANLEATIRRSVEVGINHIETARGYGSSERQLGLILPKFPRKDIIVQTKIVPNQDPAKFREEFEESLVRLRLDHVDLLSLHGINNEETAEWSVRPGGCLAAARQIQAEGLAKHIGFSTHGWPDLVLKMVSHDGDGGFDYVNLHWYWIYQRNWPAVVEATRRDMGVFIISPSDKGGMLYKAPDRLRELTAPVHPIIFNDLFCLMRPEVHTLSVGASRPSDFDEHVEALDKWWDQREELVPAIENRLRQALGDFAGSDYAATFDEGVPDWTKLPYEVNVSTILWLHLLSEALGIVEYGQMRYNLLGNGGHWFPGRNMAACEDSEKLFAALSTARHADRIPGHLQAAHARLYKEPVQRLSAGD